MNYYYVIIQDAERNQWLTLYHGEGLFDYFKLKKLGTASQMEEKVFAHRNLFKDVVDDLANMIPPQFEVALKPIDMDPDTPPDESTQKRMDAFARWWDKKVVMRCWEGSDTLFQALPTWRPYLFCAGDLFVKIPTVQDPEDSNKLIVQPVRMSSINVMIRGDGKTQKGVTGFQFIYNYLSANTFTTMGSGIYVMEQMFKDANGKQVWTSTNMSEDLKTMLGAPMPLVLKPEDWPWPFLPVAHMPFEPNFDHPRGIPVARHIMPAVLDYLTGKTLINMNNRQLAHQALVLINCQGDTPRLGPGAVMKINSNNPNPAVQADAKVIGGNSNMSCIEEQIKADKREAYQAGHSVCRDDKEQMASGGSGRAQEKSETPQQAFIDKYTTREGAFFADLIYRMAVIELDDPQLKPEEIEVKYGRANVPNIEEKTLQVQTYLETNLKKYAYKVLGHSDAEAEEMVIESEAQTSAHATEGNTGPNPDEQLDENGNPIQPEPAKAGEKPPIPPKAKEPAEGAASAKV